MIENHVGGTMVTGPHIEWAAMLTLQHRLDLEIKGIKGRPNVCNLIKKKYGLRGNREKVLAQFKELVKQKREEADREEAPKTEEG